MPKPATSRAPYPVPRARTGTRLSPRAPSGNRDYDAGTGTTTKHIPPCEDILILKEKVAAIEAWRIGTEAELKEIFVVISQVKLLITLSIGGGGLSVITLLITISRLINP